MTSMKKILANRRNALKSSGPRTDEGKRTSSLNALKNGLYARLDSLPERDQNEFKLLLAEAERNWQPVGFQEQELVLAIAVASLQERRALEIEFQLYAEGTRRCKPDELLQLAGAFQNASPMIERASRQMTTAERRRNRAIDRLITLQETRGGHQAGSESDGADIETADIGTNGGADEAEPPDAVISADLLALMTGVAAVKELCVRTGAAARISVADKVFAETNPLRCEGEPTEDAMQF